MYSPIGAFDVSAPLLQSALDAAKEFAKKLPGITRGLITRIYLHWAVEPFGCTDGQYNAEVDLEDGAWVMVLTHDPRDNAPGVDNNAEASHTWHRNTGALGIAISGMDGATATNFGPDGVQLHELEYLCALAAICAIMYRVDTNGTVPAPGSDHADNNDANVNTTGEHNILTHGECAVIDAYPTERWDLGCLHALPEGVQLTPEMRSESGDALRARIHLYAEALKV